MIEDASKTFILSTLSTDSFVPVNKKLLKYFNGDATLALLLCELISIYKYCIAHNMVNEVDSFPLSVAYLEKSLGLSHFKQQNALKKLQAENLVTVAVLGKPASRWVSINFEVLQSILSEKDPKQEEEKAQRNEFYSGINEAVKTKDDAKIYEALGNIKNPLRSCIVLVSRHLQYNCIWDGKAIGKLKYVVASLNKNSNADMFDYGRFIDVLKACNEHKDLMRLISEMQIKWKRVAERPLGARVYSITF